MGESSTRCRSAAALLGLAALSGCLQVIGPADAGPPACCSLDCVATTIGCGLFPEGTPDFTCVVLLEIGNQLDSGTAIAEYAAGDSCPSIKADAGYAALQATIGANCPGPFLAGNCDSACLTCRQACGQTASDCNADCLDAGGYYGCLGCNAGCNRQQAVCEAACIAG
jgi:hypothetical protein